MYCIHFNCDPPPLLPLDYRDSVVGANDILYTQKDDGHVTKI